MGNVFRHLTHRILLHPCRASCIRKHDHIQTGNEHNAEIFGWSSSVRLNWVRDRNGRLNIFTPTPDSAQEALDLYYNTIPDSALPTAPAGLSLPASDAVITRVLIGSRLDEEKGPSAAMTSLSKEEADLFLMVGDNVYGDRDGRSYVNNQTDLEELRESFADLAAREDFQKVRESVPMMVSWDDHDYGANDAGSEFPFRGLADPVRASERTPLGEASPSGFGNGRKNCDKTDQACTCDPISGSDWVARRG